MRKSNASIISILILMCMGWMAYAYLWIISSQKDDRILELEQQLESIAETVSIENDSKYDEMVTSYEAKIDAMQAASESLQTEHNDLMSRFYNVSDKYLDAQRQLRLLEEYSYALYDTEGYRNDLTVELLELGDSLMRANNLDPNILFGIIMVESEGHADLVDHRLEASGLGQFLEDTGEWVCSALMGGEIDYDHSTTPFDPEINIRMMVVYLSWLSEKYDNVTIDMIQQYCGGSDANTQNYYNKLSRVIGYRP